MKSSSIDKVNGCEYKSFMNIYRISSYQPGVDVE